MEIQEFLRVQGVSAVCGLVAAGQEEGKDRTR
ncbi:hypothetical protein Slip_0275 [Syntrophothermus lipocalidus DSM 12680]|uniref:Uncharacterized protein n=1 Tax=Syntrophothermus lipocalidus (strain DSM 12680 / TGB-C1) TaxID=643648 RepID=D7CJU8_SYNLT|nr:hypothetical protein Slip_0275 [Syntrophothermus lipocalidus DSM 12680]